MFTRHAYRVAACALAVAATTTFLPIGVRAAPEPAANPDALTTVMALDDYFYPADVTVPAGTIMRWTNGGRDVHTVTSDIGAFESGYLYPGMSYSRMFATPGTYVYHCRRHGAEGMVGRVVVTEPSPTTPGADLARGKPVHASSQQVGHLPEHAVDGDLQTYWASAAAMAGAANALGAPKLDLGGAATDSAAGTLTGPVASAAPLTHNPQWIYVDLGRTEQLIRFHMLWNVGHHARSYGVYVYQAGCGWCAIGRTTTGDGDDTLTLVRPVSSRYVLLGLVYPAVPNGSYELRDWQVFGAGGGSVPPPTTERNVALGRPANASSSQADHAPGAATDGMPATAWRSTMIPAWIYVDFGQSATVRRAVLRWEPGYQATRYAIYAWVAGRWVGLYSTAAGMGGNENVALPSVNTRYVLVNSTAGPGTYVGLTELEVYGTTGASYPLAEPLAKPAEPMWAAPAEPTDGAGYPDVGAAPDAALDTVPGVPEIDAPSAEGFPQPSVS